MSNDDKPDNSPDEPQNNEPADLGDFRARREEVKRERRGQKAVENLVEKFFTVDAPDYGLEIPPRLNPDVSDMLDRVKACYVGLTQRIVGFQDEIVALADTDELDPGERTSLLEHYRHLQEAVDAATADALKCDSVAVHDFTDSQGHIPDSVHRLADHAKYVYAVGTRDIAAMQYRLAELAHTGRLDFEVHNRLQWNHCLEMWKTLYYGTTSAVRDWRTWDYTWDWADNTYSDGRQVMAQVRVKNWEEAERNWPYHGEMCGDGPIQEHRRGSVCQIAPVHDDCHYYPTIEIDLEELIERCR
jgi:hypothetical protein